VSVQFPQTGGVDSLSPAHSVLRDQVILHRFFYTSKSENGRSQRPPVNLCHLDTSLRPLLPLRIERVLRLVDCRFVDERRATRVTGTSLRDRRGVMSVVCRLRMIAVFDSRDGGDVSETHELGRRFDFVDGCVSGVGKECVGG
jgi:hypothetical protein